MPGAAPKAKAAASSARALDAAAAAAAAVVGPGRRRRALADVDASKPPRKLVELDETRRVGVELLKQHASLAERRRRESLGVVGVGGVDQQREREAKLAEVERGIAVVVGGVEDLGEVAQVARGEPLDQAKEPRLLRAADEVVHAALVGGSVGPDASVGLDAHRNRRRHPSNVLTRRLLRRRRRLVVTRRAAHRDRRPRLTATTVGAFSR